MSFSVINYRVSRFLVFSAVLPAFLFIAGCSKQDTLTGYVEGRLAFIASPYGGTLIKLPGKRGEVVTEGQKLFVLEERPEQDAEKQVRAEIDNLMVSKEQAQANFIHADKLLARREILAKKHVISAEDLDNSRIARKDAFETLNSANALLKVARAKLAAATWLKLEKTVSAKKSGTIFDTYFLPSEFVPAGSPVLSILSPQDKYVIFYVPERLLQALTVGKEVQISCDGAKKSVGARVSLIYPKAEFTPPVLYTDDSRTSLLYKVEANFKDDSNQVCAHLGQPVKITLSSNQ